MRKTIRPVITSNMLLITVMSLLPLLPPTVDAAGFQEREQVTPITPELEEDYSTLLPFSREIRRGRLSNGVEYFLRSHGHPEDTVVLRLVVDAGSVQEKEGQEGLAHFVEHMAFRGTEDFAEGDLVAYLESLGMRFGPDINAYTSFDETVYKLEIPADDEEALNRGFRVMNQWATAITFDQDAIESERGVIVEEWRRGRGASARIMDEHIPVLLEDSHYADRLPIGDMDVVRNAPRRRLVDFFERWYRPDNIALIAVGDLPLDRMEDLVRRHMGTIPPRETPLDRPYHFVPPGEGTRISIASDPEATRSSIAIYIPDRPDPMLRVKDYRAILVRSLFASVLNERFRDLTRDPESPLRSAGVGWSRFVRDTEITLASATIRDDRVQDALKALVTELERAERYGILETELERARSRMMQAIDDALANARTRRSGRLADELVRHWTQGEPVPGIEFEHHLYTTLLPTITREEVESVAHRFTRDRNRIVLAGLRDDGDGRLPDGSALPTSDELHTILRAGEERAIAPPVPEDQHSRLLETEPPPGEIERELFHPEVATREYHLTNGMRLFVRSSDLKEDEILFSAYSPGGLSRVSDELAPAARIMSDVAKESGLGTLDASGLERMLAGRSIEFSTRLEMQSEGMRGSTRREDLDLLFQIVHLAFTQPRFDQRALENVRSRLVQNIQGVKRSPQGIFGRRFQELFSAGDPRRKPLEEEVLGLVTLDQLKTVYHDRFGDPGDFALFLVGNLERERIEELAQRYLAGIPARERSTTEGPEQTNRGFRETVQDTGYALQDAVVSETVRFGREPVAQVAMLFHSDYEWSRRENHRFNSLSDLLSIRLREAIREEAGGTYGVGASGWRVRDPEARAYMQVFFGMDPDRSEELIDRTLEVIQEVRRTPASEDHLDRIKAQQREQYRRGLRENGYWLNALQFAVQHGRELDDIPEFPRLIEELTAEDIRATAERYLHVDRRIQLGLQPAKRGEH